jgi:hypothetical protein
MIKTLTEKISNLPRLQTIIIIIISLVILGSILLLFGGIRNFVITAVENIIFHRTFANPDKHHQTLINASSIVLFLFCILFFIFLLTETKLSKSLKQLAILFLFIFTPIVFLIHYPINNELLVDSGDGLTSFMTLSLTPRALSEGEFPVWNKYLLNGMPAIGSASLINIPALILGWLPLQWFVFLLYCLHISCAAFFMYLYLREIKCNSAVALAVAFMLLFSVHLGGLRKPHIWIICAVSHFPLLMFLIQRHLNTEKIKYLALASGVLAFAFSYTQTQHVVYMATASGIYLLLVSIKNQVKLNALIKRIAVFSVLFLVFSAITLFPMIELIREYGKNGAGNVWFEFFVSGSITPISLVYMLFPRFFGNEFYTYNGYLPASEFDIEFFIGIMALVVVLYSIKTYVRQNFQIMISLVMCLIVFAYMSIGFIPLLRDLVYRMPIFGNFRVPSRMLFVFLFFLYSTIGLGLTKLSEGDMTLFFKFQRRFTTLILIITCALTIILIAVMNILGGPERGANIESVLGFAKEALLPPLLVLFCTALAFWLIDTFSKNHSSFLNEQSRYHAIIAVICIVTLIETIPFFSMTYSSPAVKIAEDNVTKKLSANIGNGKIFDAYTGKGGGHQSLISQNKSISKNLPSINAYVPFNNPVLYRFISGGQRESFNSSGLLIGSSNARENIMYQNDLLSMMGVKYIIDSSELLPEEGSSTYQPFHNDGQNRIFENVNARDILYFPEAVKGIDDTEYLFDNPYGLNLDKISYIPGAEDRTFNLNESTIKDIIFKNNTITSMVESTNGNFLNFSQNYFPGWRVYIDGKRAELKQVNALIMGVYVPSGIHTVKFSFVSMSFIWGIIFTFTGIIAYCVLFVLLPYRNRKKSNA